MGAWYWILTKETRGYIHVAGFEPIIHLLPERSTSAILVQILAKRWWDATRTFHIADREMIITPHDFHRMTSLRCDRALINLEGESGTQLGINLLGRKYTTDTIRYLDIEADYMLLPQVMVDDYTKMARAFLLYLLGAYLFANEGQTMGYLCQASPTAGTFIDPSRLPWSVYTYGPNGFACEHAMGHNTNVMGYLFLRVHEQ